MTAAYQISDMRKFLLLFVCVCIGQLLCHGYNGTVNAKVGDTFTVNAGYYSRIQGVTWSYDYGVLQSVSISGYSTSATFKATRATTSSGCVIQATVYYYKNGTTSSGVNKDVVSWKVYVEDNEVLVTRIDLNKTYDELEVGATTRLTASVYPSNATNKTVGWLTNNYAVASVVDGVVTAKSPGTAIITCVANDSGNAKAQCTIKVTEQNIHVTSVELNKTYDELEIGKTTQLTATVYPSNATNKTVSWTSSNSSIATVSTSGLVTAKGVGTATITCSAKDSGSAKATCTIKVKEKEVQVTRIELNKTSDELEVGKTTQLTATVYPSNATNKTVSWTSSNSSVAAVSTSGLVTAKGVGTATITCNAKDSGNAKATCTIKVKAKDYIEYNGIRYKILENNNLSVVPLENGQYQGSIVIPASVTSDGVKYKVTEIGEDAFYQCINLTTVTIPNSVTAIGDYAFASCRQLSIITIPNSVTTIGVEVFYGCSGLISVVLPNSITRICEYTFNGCSNLTSITIPNSVIEIGPSAFGRSGLTSVLIPNSVTNIGVGPFKDCEKLTEIKVDLNNQNYCAVDGVLFDIAKSKLIQYPAGRKDAQYTIPNTVTQIENRAFTGCSGLNMINIYNVTPPNAGYFTFDSSSYESVKLGVLASVISKYKAHDVWGQFKKIESVADSPIDSVESVIADSEPPVYFDLQGLRVEIPVKGRLYIRLQNGKAEKVFIE